MKSFLRMKDEAQAVAVRVTDDFLELVLADGRRIATPLTFYPTLLAANQRQRDRFEYIADATAIDWPLLDLQLSVDSIVKGRREVVAPPGFQERTIASLKAAGLKLPPRFRSK